MEFLETIFRREKYKVYTAHLSLARKHIERAEKIIQVSDDRLMLAQEEIARVERDRSCKICMDRPTLLYMSGVLSSLADLCSLS